MQQQFPSGSRCISLEWFNVLSALSFVRYNYQLFNGDALEGRFERDSISASKIRICEMVLQFCAEDPEFVSDAVEHLASLFNAFDPSAVGNSE